MTTTSRTRPVDTVPRTARPARTHLPARTQARPGRRAALVAAVSLAAGTMLSIPATALLDTADRPVTRVLVGVGFVGIATLEVVVGWGLYVVLHQRAHSSAYAALVSRAGYAVLLAAAAGRLLWPGGDGVAGFRADWSLALLVLGVHLLVTSVALWHSHAVPGVVVVGTAVAGTTALFGDAVGRWPLPDIVPGAGPMLPGVLGGLVLLAWLLLVSGRVNARDAGSAEGA